MSNKHRLTISVDAAQYDFHGLGARNASQYINQLLVDKTRTDNVDRLAEELSQRLIVNPDFIFQLRKALQGSSEGRYGVDFDKPEDYA